MKARYKQLGSGSIVVMALAAAVLGWQESGWGEQAELPVASLPRENVIAPSTGRGAGNPLWDLPISSLTATRARPIFTPGRRPPAIQSPAPYQLQSLPTRPPFALVGAIAGETEGIAILVEAGTKTTVRLRQGESHAGWTVHAVKAREVTLKNGRQLVVIELAAPRTK